MDEVIVQFGSPSPAYGRPSRREGDLHGKTLAQKLDDLSGEVVEWGATSQNFFRLLLVIIYRDVEWIRKYPEHTLIGNVQPSFDSVVASFIYDKAK